MPEPDARAMTLRSLTHPALAVLLPFLFLQAFDAVIRLGIFSGIIPMPPGSLIIVFLMGVSQMMIAGFLKRERITGVLPQVREVVLMLAAAWVILILLSGRPFRGDFSLLNEDQIWPLVLCATQWLLTKHVYDALQPREIFFALVKGKAGHELVAAARDAGGEAGDSHQGLGRLTNLAVVLEVFSILPYVGLRAVLALRGVLVPGITVRLLLFAVSGVVFMVVINGFREEQELSLAGIAPDPDRSVRRSAGPCAGVLVLFVVGLLLTGRGALLPLSLIQRFLHWLRNLWPKVGPMPVEQLPPPPTGDILGSGGLGGVPVFPEVKESPLLAAMLRIAVIVLAAAAAAAFLFIIIRPLLSRETRQALRRARPLRAAARRVRAFLRLLARLPAAFAAWARSPGRRLSSIPRAIMESIRESTADTRRAAEAQELSRRLSRGRAVHEFRRLARWGRKGGVALRESEGPMEYCRLLAARWPEKAAPLGEAGLLFEELVYARAPAGRGERALARIVDGIVR